jgi:hypothetical protein
MPNELEATTHGVARNPETLRSLEIFEKGIRTSGEFKSGFAALMTDTVAGRITPQVCNAVCNAGGKILKTVEMEHKWGRKEPETGEQLLKLTE